MTTTAEDQTTPTQYAVSADGTRIAYEATGEGPPVVLVDGALCDRANGHARPLAAALAPHLTVHAYDRRGRGESDAGHAPYHPDREIEDLAAVIAAAGGRAHVFGASSGATLALRAAAAGLPIDRLAVYESPCIVDDTRSPSDPALAERTRDLVEAGRNGEAVRLFLRTVGLPAPVVAVMRLLPVWKRLAALAPTLPHDYALVLEQQQGRPLPEGLYDAVTSPTLVLVGGKSPTYMQHGQAALAAAVPGARLESLPGQTHLVRPKATAPVVLAHFCN